MLRDTIGDGSSEDTSVTLVDVVASDSIIKISAMILHPKREVLFCGKDDGSVSVYDMKDGAELKMLYRHKSLVRTLTWWGEADALMSIDASNRIFTWHLERSHKEGWLAEKTLFQSRLDCGSSITHALVGEAAGKFVLSTRLSDHFWSFEGLQQHEHFYSDNQGPRRWIQHPQSPLHMICIEGEFVRIYSWDDWSAIASVTVAMGLKGLQPKNAIPYSAGTRQQMVLEYSELNGSPDTRSVHIFDIPSLGLENLSGHQAVPEIDKITNDVDQFSLTKDRTTTTVGTATATPGLSSQLQLLAKSISHIIGLSSSTYRLVFLDTHSWVCSTNFKNIEENSPISYSRHFFVPYDWFAGTRDIICAMAHPDVLFARNGAVAVVKGGLDHVEMVCEGSCGGT